MVKINFKQTFTALRHRNYRLWFIGQITSLFGSWMQRTAETFLIFELTHSPVYLGYVGFANGLPSWLFMLYGGVVADRIPRRTILIVTQTVMMILAFILAFLTLTGAVTPWSVIVLAFGLGVANAFDAPARQAFVLELIDRKDLINAIALNATMFNGATAVGPAIAGFTYAAFGPAWCFMINGISFIGVIAALFMMKLKPMEKNLSRKSPLAELKEGFAYLKDKRLIQLLMAFTMITATFGLSLVTLMPAWAVKVLHGGASTNGLLQSARGAGALVSALFLATISRKKIKGKLITTGSFAFGIFLFIFSWVSWLPLSLLLLFGIGMANILILNVNNGLVQSSVSDEFRGRVMGIYSIVFFGAMPIGALLLGTMAEHLGEHLALIISSLVLFLFALSVYIFVPKLRKVE